jgi:hypothetical protein
MRLLGGKGPGLRLHVSISPGPIGLLDLKKHTGGQFFELTFRKRNLGRGETFEEVKIYLERAKMPGKRIEFDRETLLALEELAGDRMATLQELIDEAITDLLKKYHRPIGLKEQLKQSVQAKVPARSKRSRRK